MCCSLSEGQLAKAEPAPSSPHSTAVTKFLGGGGKQKAVSGRGQGCCKLQRDAAFPKLPFILGISVFRINHHFALGPKR